MDAKLPEKSWKVKLTQVEKEKICVELWRKAGDKLYFYEQFQFIKDELSDINDAIDPE